MHISLTPELECIIKEKVASGFYSNASEVVYEALRFMNSNEELMNQLKVDQLRTKLAVGETDLKEGRFTELLPDELVEHFNKIKQRAVDSLNRAR